MKGEARAKVRLRFEDITQDGRVVVAAFQHMLGATTWPSVFANPWALKLRDEGVIPILTHLTIASSEGPFSAVEGEVEAVGAWEMGHTKSDAGEVERLLVTMRIEAYARIGRTYGPPPERQGERALAGTVYAEHVISRLFAPPDQRKVTRLDAPGIDPVPPRELPFTVPESVSETSAPVIHEHEETVVFALAHTDSNQHVNSLVYQRLFEEAVVRATHASAGARAGALLCRTARLGYRKPFFAGDAAKLRLRVHEDRRATGTFVGASGRAHVHVSMTL